MTLLQILKSQLGTRFEDIRSTLATHPTLRFSQMNPTNCKYLALHHTAGPEKATWQDIARFHVSGGRGEPFAGIGYHFGIRYGMGSYLGSIETQRAHVFQRNNEALGIVVAGDYTTRDPSPENVEVLILLIQALDTYFGHAKQIMGHRDLNPGRTVCPGDRLARLIPTLRIPSAPTPETTIAQKAEAVRWHIEQATRDGEAGELGLVVDRLKAITETAYEVENYLKGRGL